MTLGRQPLQMDLFAPPSDWRPPRLADLPQSWDAHPRIGLDTETFDPTLKTLGPGVRRGGYVVGISLAFEGHSRWYLPVRHGGGDNMEDPARVWDYLRHNARRYTGLIVGAKLAYDLDFLAEQGVEFPSADFLDVQVAEPLIDDTQFQYNLDAILKRYGMPSKDEALLKEAAAGFGFTGKTPALGVKRNLHALPARYVGPYAEADAELPLGLMRRQEDVIERLGLERVWRLERQVLPILVKMRRRGVRVDRNHLAYVEAWARAEELRAWGEVHRHTGVSINVGDGFKTEVVAHALAAVGIIPGKTRTGKPSITAGWLASLDAPVAPAIRRARQMSQLQTTFVASIRDHLVGDRIHCTFNQVKMSKDDDRAVGEDEADETAGAGPGRLSCQDPNLQQQPARDKEIGPLWRRIYLPDEGGLWCSPDFS